MPIYEYKCTACGERVEFLQLRKDETPPKRCPMCKHKLERLYDIGRTCMYKRGKNPSWPLTESSDDGLPSGKEYD